MGILSPSKIFTKHGDKMIFKNPILSPSKIYDNVSVQYKREILQKIGAEIVYLIDSSVLPLLKEYTKNKCCFVC